LAGAAYVYGRWNDSTAVSHTIKVKRGNKTIASPATSPAVTVYTANFIGLASYTSAVVPADAGTVNASPPAQSYSGASGVFYVARQKVTLTAAANTNYSFLEWSRVNAPWSANPKTDYAPENSGNVFRTSMFVNANQINVDPTSSDLAAAGAFPVGVSNFPSDAPCSAYPAHTFFVSTP
jgi:hypothetical protein